MKRVQRSILLMGFVVSFTTTYAQETEGIDFQSLDLEDLMNITIVSASGKEETVFNAPLSSYSITKEEIVNSGVTSIPEALRLCPGVIVREYSNGNYDIHLNGFDNLPRYTVSRTQLNGLTLVMIDNRPVFNYNYGFTYWEALPIDLLDVERIEIVRGPSAPLFGPNAVTGVINIITRKPTNTGFDASGNVQYGSENTFIYNSAISYKFNKKWDVTVSGNYQARDRHDELYYDFSTDAFTKDPTEQTGAPREVNDKDFSLERFGINAFINYYEENKDVNVNFSTGYTKADVQKVFFGDPAPTNNNTDNFYLNLNTQVKNWGINASFVTGFDELLEESGAFDLSSSYDFNVFNGTLNHTFTLSNLNLEIVPSFNYQHIVYDDSEYIDNFTFGGPLNGKKDLNVWGGGLKLDYQPFPKLRLVSALRLDKYDIPDDTYFAYQFIATYSVSDDFLVRVVHARSNSGSFILNSFENVTIQVPSMNGNPARNFNGFGNENLSLTTNTMTEVGARWQVLENLQFDWSAFYQNLEDLNSQEVETVFDPTSNTLDIASQWQNTGVSGEQYGTTLSINWLPFTNFSIKPFVTLQTTNAKGIEGFEIRTVEHKSTPNVFGGAYLNYGTRKLNINLNPYFTGEQIFYNIEDLNRESETGEISANLIVNAKVTYRATDKLSIYINGRNIGGDSRQHYGSDRVKGLYLGGLSYNF